MCVAWHSDTVKSADDTEVAIRDCPTMSVGSDLRLLNKPVSVFPYLYSKRRSDPTKNNGQSQIATSVSSADFTVSLSQGFKKPQIVCKRGFFDKIFCEKNLPKSAPPSPQKMSFSSDLCHFKTTLAQF